jgi:RNA polymerase sigma factor (sigma-70 family)
MTPNEHQHLSDEELAEATRSGDSSAFGELWQRHSKAGMAAARQFRSIADPDDIVAEAYLHILGAVQRGGGPREAFRPYLYRTIRNVALRWKPASYSVPLDEAGDLVDERRDTESSTLEKTITVRAFRTLPERWQTVLWYTEVEGMEPAEAAPFLGITPNSAAALAYRARDGLKKAWLQAHVNDRRVPPECRWTTERMGEYSRGGLTPRARERFDDHLAGCTRCSILVEELDNLSGRLAAILFPLVLGGTAGSGLLAELLTRPSAPEPSSVASGSAAGASSASRLLSGHGRTVLVATSAAAVVIAAGSAVFAMAGGFSPDRTSPIESSAARSSPSEGRDPQPQQPLAYVAPEPPSPDEPELVPFRPVVPTPPAAADEVVPPSVPADSIPPAAPELSAPASGELMATSSPLFSGQAEPGSRVEVVLLAADRVTPLDRVATTSAGADGTWSVVASAVPDGVQLFRIVQVDAAGNSSEPVTVELTIDTVALAPSLDALPTSPMFFLPVVAGDAEPEAAIQLRDDLGAVIGSTSADAAGRWSFALPDPGRDGSAVSAQQVDRAGNVSPLSAQTAPLSFNRPSLVEPTAGETVPSDGGSTVVSVQISGVPGMTVQVYIDGVSTGNLHTLESQPIVRVTPALADGAHSIGVRYYDPGTNAPGSVATTHFVIG